MILYFNLPDGFMLFLKNKCLLLIVKRNNFDILKVQVGIKV